MMRNCIGFIRNFLMKWGDFVGRPAKPAAAIEADNKRQRVTKREIASRKAHEKALLTGKKIVEQAAVKNNPIAHAEFLRVSKLMGTIGKNDDLYGAIINRYCMMAAECDELHKQKTKIATMAEETTDPNMSIKLQKLYDGVDKNLDAKRKMMAEIEKENCMTVASALRSIPKKPDAEIKNPILEILNGN